MTTAAVPEYTSNREREVGPADRAAFKLDGDSYVLLRPKLAIATQMMRLAETDSYRSVSELGLDLTRLLLSILGYIEEEDPEPVMLEDGETPNPNAGKLRGQALLRHRLSDPKDGFDLPDLEPIFRDLVKAMFGRPTQARPEPSPKPAATAGRGSKAGSRSKAGARSGKPSKATATRSSRSATTG